MAVHRCALVFPALALVACASPRGEDTVGEQGPPAPSAHLEDVESRVLTSSVSGRDYMISVALPLGYADSTKAYPVLYALDANGQFGTVVEAARILRIGGDQIPQLIIVGIGYPYGGRQVNAGPHRIIDFFPTLEFEWIEEVKQGWPGPLPTYESGGAKEFLGFLREELFSLVENQYRADPFDRAIYGHSGGGWFGLYALLEGHGAFQRVIAGSPSLWWDDRLMFEIEERYAEANRTLPAKVFLSVGEDEGEGGGPGTDCYCMVSNLRDFVATVSSRGYEGFEWFHHVFEDENHQSVVAPTVSRGLRYVYGSFP